MTAPALPRPALGRVAAVLALGSAGVHLLLLDGGAASVVMLAMAAVCLPCAVGLWRSPSGSVWRTTALVDAAMLVLHLQMLGAHAGHGTDMPGMGPDPLMMLGLGLVTAQLALAAVAALRRA